MMILDGSSRISPVPELERSDSGPTVALSSTASESRIAEGRFESSDIFALLFPR